MKRIGLNKPQRRLIEAAQQMNIEPRELRQHLRRIKSFAVMNHSFIPPRANAWKKPKKVNWR